MDYTKRQTWVYDCMGNLIMVLGQIRIKQEVIGDKIIMRFSYPVYRLKDNNK